MKTKDFVLLLTGEKDNDTAVCEYLGKGRAVAIYKLGYTLPCDRFDGIKGFQLKTRGTLLTPSSPCVAVNITEWVGHEYDEYFDISMKFFHDQVRMKYVFTVGGCSKAEAEPIFKKISSYMKGSMTSVATKRSVSEIESNKTERSAVENYERT